MIVHFGDLLDLIIAMCEVLENPDSEEAKQCLRNARRRLMGGE